jgi:hypothetical protein
MTDTIADFDSSVDLVRALLWQHDNATALRSLIESKQDWYNTNQATFWANWYRDVFNIDTANDFGLSVWGRILNVGLGLQVDSTIGITHFGFGTYHRNFNNGNFARATSGEQALSTDQKRLIIRLRYYQLISRGTVVEINEAMARIFGDLGQVFVRDPLDMSKITYVFKFTPSSRVRLILDRMNLLPRPSGIGSEYVIEV